MKLLGVYVVLKWNYMIKEYHCDIFVAMVFLVGVYMGNNSNFDKMYLPISFKTSPNNDIYRFKSYNVIHPSLSKSADFKSYSNIFTDTTFQ